MPSPNAGARGVDEGVTFDARGQAQLLARRRTPGPMPIEPILYRRHALYDEVWKEPLLTVSKRTGVSDVTLAKAGQAPRGSDPVSWLMDAFGWRSGLESRGTGVVGASGGVKRGYEAQCFSARIPPLPAPVSQPLRKVPP